MKYYISVVPVEQGGWKAKAYRVPGDRNMDNSNYSFSATAPTREAAKTALEEKINHVHEKPLFYTIEKEVIKDESTLS